MSISFILDVIILKSKFDINDDEYKKYIHIDCS